MGTTTTTRNRKIKRWTRNKPTTTKKQNKAKDDKAKDKNANEKEAYAKLAATTEEPENVPSQPPPSYETATQDGKKSGNQKKNQKKTPLLKGPPTPPQVCPPTKEDQAEFSQQGQFQHRQQEGQGNYGYQNHYG